MCVCTLKGVADSGFICTIGAMRATPAKSCGPSHAVRIEIATPCRHTHSSLTHTRTHTHTHTHTHARTHAHTHTPPTFSLHPQSPPIFMASYHSHPSPTHTHPSTH